MLTMCANGDEAVQGADALAILTEWKEFRSPDFDGLKAALATPVVFDGRNLYDPGLMRRQGFTYYAIGRGDRVPAAWAMWAALASSPPRTLVPVAMPACALRRTATWQSVCA